MRRVVICLIALGMAGLALAQVQPAADPAVVAARTEAISKTLRCVVCQNQSIHDSNAPLAADMRTLVEKRVVAGDSDDEVREYLRVRYGDYVLMRPPFQLSTFILWLGPIGLIALGALWFIVRLRRRAGTAAADDMTASDRARVEAALAPQSDEVGS